MRNRPQTVHGGIHKESVFTAITTQPVVAVHFDPCQAPVGCILFDGHLLEADSERYHDNDGGRSDDYADFCEKFGLFTDSGNYSSTAETLFKYVTGETDFEEEHTALADSIIELHVLLACRENGCDLLVNYPVLRTLPRRTLQTLTVRTMDGEEVEFEYHTKTTRNGKIYLK